MLPAGHMNENALYTDSAHYRKLHGSDASGPSGASLESCAGK